MVWRADDGTLHLRDGAGNEDAGIATFTGGTIGLLIGIIGGPLGVLLGGSLGLLAGAIIDEERGEDTDSVLERVSVFVGEGATAVLADVDENGGAPVDDAMAALVGRVERFERKDVEAEISGAEHAAHEARVQARKALRRERREATRDKVKAKLDELRDRLRRLVHA